MKIYVASSWRNEDQPIVVQVLRTLGHDVYDFHHPKPGNNGFAWHAIDPNWKNWTPDEYRKALKHPIAQGGYDLDITAVKWCDAGILVLPSGRSASWEFGHIMGQGKPGYLYMPEACEPELMYREAKILVNLKELIEEFKPAPVALRGEGEATPQQQLVERLSETAREIEGRLDLHGEKKEGKC